MASQPNTKIAAAVVRTDAEQKRDRQAAGRWNPVEQSAGKCQHADFNRGEDSERETDVGRLSGEAAFTADGDGLLDGYDLEAGAASTSRW